ncbi:MAG: RNA polymerase sigma factor [Armatimonadetes bacterium]|jgi:RNA polymerase sigma-70 factor (ECF subfamily)|nr:RNA polymerase sigma factor [Armatimonadota bacterium]
MLRLKSGDRQAFDAIVERYRDRMVSFAYRMVGNAELAQDVAQETFVRVYKSAGTFRDDGRLSPWLYRIASNVCLSERTKRAKEALNVDYDTLEDMHDSGVLVDEQALASLDNEKLARAVAKLSSLHKTALIMHVYQGMTYAEIGEAINVPTGTVKSRIFYAIRKLREVLDTE